MPAVKAADLTGRTLGAQVTVEVQDPETRKTRYVTGELIEWRGVHDKDTAMFLARVLTPDGKAGAQVVFSAEDVLYTNPGNPDKEFENIVGGGNLGN